jgi:hypothetical protein
VKCLGDFANAENFDFVAATIDETLPAEGRFVDGGASVEKIIELADVEDAEDVAEVEVVEAALWQTTMKRHLTAFETDTSA